jgi:cytochrome c2
MVKRGGFTRSCDRPGCRDEGKGGVIGGYGVLLRQGELLRDGLHFRVAAAAGGVSLHLGGEIAPVEASEPWRACAIAQAVDAVAGDAGKGRACISAAERDEFAGGGEAVSRTPLDRTAGRKAEGDPDRQCCAQGHGTGNRFGIATVPCLSSKRRVAMKGMMRLLCALPLLLAVSCKPPPEEMQHMPQADPVRGEAVAERVGCAACHDIPGIRWPKGKSGPSLHGFADQGLIAGRVANRPDNLAGFVRDAPAVVPGTAMPAMPISETEARDVAAFLYSRRK